MILITSAAFCPSEFGVEFGKIPPSFLPLRGQRLYEFQARLFKKFKPQRAFLSLPQGFELSSFELKRLKKCGLEPIFVPTRLNLAQSINYCLNTLLPLTEPLIILHGDSYFLRLDYAPNALGVSKALNSYDWVSLNDTNTMPFNVKDSKKFTPKKTTQNSQEFVLNGYFCIEKPYDFIRALLRANYDFILALKIYSSTHPFSVLCNDEWFDFGLLSAYFNSKSTLTTQRIFNDLCLQDGYLLKSSKDKDKIKAEIEWFKVLPKHLSLFAPRFMPDKKGYKTQYLCLNTLAEILVFSALPSFAYKQIFASLKDFLEKLSKIKATQNFDFDYKKKSLERLKEFARQRDFNLNQGFIFNGKALPSLLEICEFLDEFISLNAPQSFIHGDFCLSNIFYDFRTQRIVCFDPRGRDFSGVITPFGESRYDVAKLAQCFLGLYDFIVFGFYECEFKQDLSGYSVRFSLPLNENLQDIQALFLASFKNIAKSELLALCVHLFLSMLPLHYEDEKRQNALLANALRCFDELLVGAKKSKKAFKSSKILKATFNANSRALLKENSKKGNSNSLTNHNLAKNRKKEAN